MFVSIPRAGLKRWLGREVAISTCPIGTVPGAAHFDLVLSLVLIMVIFFLCNALVPGFLKYGIQLR